MFLVPFNAVLDQNGTERQQGRPEVGAYDFL